MFPKSVQKKKKKKKRHDSVMDINAWTETFFQK